jgi:hypothetical protein
MIAISKDFVLMMKNRVIGKQMRDISEYRTMEYYRRRYQNKRLEFVYGNKVSL